MPLRAPFAAYDWARNQGWTETESVVTAKASATLTIIMGVLAASIPNTLLHAALLSTGAVYMTSVGIAANMSMDWPSAELASEKPEGANSPLMKVSFWPHMEAYGRSKEQQKQNNNLQP